MTRLETARLVLRDQRESDAAIFHRLWTERDPRVPDHRRIDADGRPTVADVAAHIRADLAGPEPRLLTVERGGSGEVIGYCGLTTRGNGSPDAPELAFELLRAVHGHGYGTEAARAVVDASRAAGRTRLVAGVWDWNGASRAVLRRLGFVETAAAQPVSRHGRSILAVLDLQPPVARHDGEEGVVSARDHSAPGDGRVHR